MTFTTVLVANRGEIAEHLLRTARAAGYRTVAVYSDADRSAHYISLADSAVRLGPASPTESYLNIDAIIAAAKSSSADAINPGYGFLSERAAFARACADAGITFVGPPADVIELMGRKDEARRIAVAAGVPVVPAIEGDSLVDRAGSEVGFPLLVKAAAGGGGKGMRIVAKEAELEDALASARREARSAFGDDTMLIERYVERGRHIEVQVIADRYGDVRHLYTRDCSVQRRHQKVVEEAPASAVPVPVAEALHDAAVRLTAKVGYVNVGTIEFLVDGDEFYFLEMNTRLQVEHGVTDLVCGVDLADAQLRIAAGERLTSILPGVVSPAGHAIEVRVYAEDPAQDFLPQAGTPSLVRWSGGFDRVHSTVATGMPVSSVYDPMLAKLIVHGQDRDSARRKLVSAIDDSALLGITSNLGFLRRLCDSAEFAAAGIDTAWLDRNPGAFASGDPSPALEIAARAVVRASRQGPADPFGSADGWRSAGPAAASVAGFEHAGEHHDVWIDPASAPDDADVVVLRSVVQVAYEGEGYAFTRSSGRRGDEATRPVDGAVTAPMPGVLLAVHRAVGDTVTRGDALGVMEAMKMELTLRAPGSGVVAAVGAGPGAQVALGQLLFTVDVFDEEHE